MWREVKRRMGSGALGIWVTGMKVRSLGRLGTSWKMSSSFMEFSDSARLADAAQRVTLLRE